MELAVDGYLAVPLLFTLLAILVASLYLKFRASDETAKNEAASSKVNENNAEEKPKTETEDERKPEDVSEELGAGESELAKAKLTVEEVGAADGEQEPAPSQERESQVKQEPTRPEEKLKEDEEGIESTKTSEAGAETESTKTTLPDDVTDDLVDEYRPGKIQRSSYEKTLTKEQLEEEKRSCSCAHCFLLTFISLCQHLPACVSTLLSLYLLFPSMMLHTLGCAKSLSRRIEPIWES